MNFKSLYEISWIYNKDTELNGLPFWGVLHGYPGGGYIQDLAPTKHDSLNILHDLRPHWIDPGTRVVLIEFSTYNANINMFCLAK